MKTRIFYSLILVALLLIGAISCEKETPAPLQTQNDPIPQNDTTPLTNEEKILGVWAENIPDDNDWVYDTLIFHPNGSVSAVALFDEWKYQLSDERILFYKDPNYNYPPQLISGDSLTYRYSFVGDDTIVFYNFLTLSLGAMIYNVKYHKIGSL